MKEEEFTGDLYFDTPIKGLDELSDIITYSKTGI